MRKKKLKNKIIFPILTISTITFLCLGISINHYNLKDVKNDSTNSMILAWDENGDYFNSTQRQVNTKVSKSADLSGGESESYSDATTAVTETHFNESTTINGSTCTSFYVGHGTKVASKGEIFSNQNALKYTVRVDPYACPEISYSYTTFCLDPNTDGYYGSSEARYTAQPLSLDTKFGQYMYALYDVYRNDPDASGKYFEYMTAARILSLAPDSDYSPLRKTTKARMNSHTIPYKNWGSSDIGPVYSGAAGIVDAVRNKVAAGLTEANDNPSRGLSLSTYTIYNEAKGSYVTTINVMIENVLDEATANDILSNHNLTYKLGGNPVTVDEKDSSYYDEKNKTVIITGELDIDGSKDDCNSYELMVAYKYDNPYDIRNAYLLVPSNPNDAHQRFAAFNNFAAVGDDTGSSETTITNKIMINMGSCDGDCIPGEPGCPDDGDCIPGEPDCPGDKLPPPPPNCTYKEDLDCDDEDINITNVVEGYNTDTGSVDWNTCIIDHTDIRGNSYNIVDTTNVKNTHTDGTIDEDSMLISDQIYARLINGEAIYDADFCKISCKEDYSFILPGNKKNIKQGTYFAFHVDGVSTRNAVVAIGAQRKCVTNKVNNTEFNKRVRDLRKQQLDFLNMYMYYSQLYNVMKTTVNAKIYINAAKEAAYTGSWPDHSSYDDRIDYRNAKNGWNEGSKTSSDILSRNAVGATKYSKYNESYRIKPVGILGNYKGDLGTNSVKIKYYKFDTNADDLNATIQEAYKNIAINSNYAASGLMINTPAQYNAIYHDYPTALFSTNVAINNSHGDTNDEKVSYHWCSSGHHHSAETCAEDEDCDDESYNVCDGHSDTDIEAVTVYYYKNWNPTWLDPTTSQVAGDEGFDGYRDMLNNLHTAAEKAKQKYDSINAQIGLQADSIQECTNYLDTIDNYKYNPRITFSYSDQEQYMNMLSPNLLVNMNDASAVKHDWIKYYCTDDRSGDPESIFSCPTAPAEGTVNTKFEFGDIFTSSYSDSYQTSIPSVSSTSTVVGKDHIEYNNVMSAGSRSLYGGYDNEGNAISGGDTWPRYEFYQSAKPFYVRRSDGIVTVDKEDDEYGSILDTDGRVYPVAIDTTEGKHSFYVNFTNIGQFFESGSLGRIMGGGDGQPGTMIGEAKDEEVCYYEVERIDDNPYCLDCYGNKRYYTEECKPGETLSECEKRLCPCGDDILCTDKDGKDHYERECLDGESKKACKKRLCPDDGGGKGLCDDVIKDYCNNGTINGLVDSKYKDCIGKLLNTDPECCTYVTSYMEIRTGFYAKKIPSEYQSLYETKCLSFDYCQGFDTLTVGNASAITTNLTDISDVNNNGALQINARATSLSNIFPNNTDSNNFIGIGTNWLTPEAIKVKDEIEALGDSIYNNDSKLQYSITMTTECLDAVKNYNKTMENEGGYNDTNYIVPDRQKQAGKEVDSKGKTVMMSDDFREILEKKCDGKIEDDYTKIKAKNTDKSSVE